MDPISLTLAAWIVTCFVTKVFDEKGEELKNEVREEGNNLVSQLKEEFPDTVGNEIELAQQPGYERQGYLTAQVQLAANRNRLTNVSIKNFEELLVKSQNLKIQRNNNKFVIENNILIIEVDALYDLSNSKFGGGFALRDQIGGTLNNYERQQQQEQVPLKRQKEFFRELRDMHKEVQMLRKEAEKAQLQAEVEARRRAETEARLRAEAEARRKEKEQEEARLRAEAEARRKEKEQEEARLWAELRRQSEVVERPVARPSVRVTR